ncbi:hypothetical protein BCR41DRAFT_104143 [Lobosporangium transversale]|uniref:Uncharacterized protein n=1 Tax=Lobosporangium transversale TaxID=64571 RepID=A0A1Y2GKZ1_9FUNG|nr:hypothetical protein BCR41DRAFT_104143 [Lobosporangium transversale]ORZ12079.1 hypothetical protein BCR41DRAFT_104143 [Lobosporangium transversale]|eukprot:XP_021879944.1 hypothetical protein BCR41DRAFT_104143 [Lobosporangium transversale]
MTMDQTQEHEDKTQQPLQQLQGHDQGQEQEQQGQQQQQQPHPPPPSPPPPPPPPPPPQQQQQQQQPQSQQQQPSPPEDVNEHEVGNRDISADIIDTPKENGGALPTPVASVLNYPPADKEIDKLSMSERMMKIGRSCPCDAPINSLPSEGGLGTSPADSQDGKCDCQGWKPKPAGTMGRVDTCACGHKLSYHGGPWTGEEFERRLRAAVRRDELLQDKGKLFDFDYDDEDISSLRKQIVPREIPVETSEPIPNGEHMANGTLTRSFCLNSKGRFS